MQTKKQNQVRYNLHRKIRKQGFKLKTRKKTIYIFFDNLEFTPAVNRLREEFGYAIQTELEK